jgi:hypothetical protein
MRTEVRLRMSDATLIRVVVRVVIRATRIMNLPLKSPVRCPQTVDCIRARQLHSRYIRTRTPWDGEPQRQVTSLASRQ